MKTIWNRIFSIVLGGLIFTPYADTVATSPSGWSNGAGGTISTLGELRWLSETTEAWDENWALGADIDASDTHNWNKDDSLGITLGFAPIGNSSIQFSGTFNGQGYEISNLYINRKDVGYVGLFGYVTGVMIQNVGVRNCEITAKSHVGGLAGWIHTGTVVSNSFSMCTINADGTSAGGLIGLSFGGKIEKVFSKSIVKSTGNQAGGLVGYLYSNSTLTDAYAIGEVEGNQDVGGLVGFQLNASLTRQYTSSKVKGATNVGAVIGRTSGTTIGYVYYDKNKNAGIPSFGTDATPGAPAIGVLSGINESQFAIQSTFATFNFSTVWRISRDYDFDVVPRLYLRWQLKDRKVEFIAGAHGSISGTAEQLVPHGTGSSLVGAVADEGYHFLKWENLDGDSLSNLPTHQLDSVFGDSALTALFEINVYTASFSAASGGKVESELTQLVKHGDSTKGVIAIADTGYYFAGWINTDSMITSTDSALVLQSVIRDTALTASFKMLEFSVSYEVSGAGVVNVSDGSKVLYGQPSYPAAAFPSPGYHFDGWFDKEGSLISSGNPFTLSSVISDTSIVAAFAKDTFTVIFESDSGGVLEGEVAQSVAYQESASAVYAIPDEAYNFAGWVNTNKDTISKSDSILIGSVVSDSVVRAVYQKKVYSFTGKIFGNIGGQLSFNKPTAFYGDTVSYAMTPANGYELDSAYYNGEKVPTNALVTGEEIRYDIIATADGELIAYFSEAQFSSLIHRIEGVYIHLQPNSGLVAIESDDPVYYEIYDLHGNRVAQNSGEGHRWEINISKMGPGVYFLKVNQNQSHMVRHFIVE